MAIITLEFCCPEIQSLINDPYCPLKYQSCMRKYAFIIPKKFLKKNHVYPNFRIQCCPMCGTKLPADLIDEWMAIIEQRFHMSGGFLSNREQKKIPKEFKTDEWWKKRGL